MGIIIHSTEAHSRSVTEDGRAGITPNSLTVTLDCPTSSLWGRFKKAPFVLLFVVLSNVYGVEEHENSLSVAGLAAYLLFYSLLSRGWNSRENKFLYNFTRFQYAPNLFECLKN